MIPFSKPDINKQDLKRVEKCIESGWLTHGPNTKNLKRYFVILQSLSFQLLFRIVPQDFI